MSADVGRLTLFQSPDTLAKSWTIDEAGALVKTSAAQMVRGVYSVPEYAAVDDLADLLDSVTGHQALSSSVPLDGSTSGRITTKRAAEPGALTRTKAAFCLPSSPGLLFLDSDDGGLSRDELWSQLLDAIPALSTAGAVWRPSGSSHIFQGDVDRTGLKGQHVFVMVKDASDGPRVVKTLAGRLWLAGLGRVVVSKAGSMLLRSPIDTAPTDAARLIFAGGAECGPGLEQRRGPPVILNRGGFHDTRELVSDLTAEEQGRYEALVEQAKAAAGPEAAQRRLEHRGAVIAQRLPAMMRRGVSATEAEQRIGAAVDAAYGGTLLSDFELTIVRDDGKREQVTVGQVLADRERWNEVDLLDPICPTHRGGAPDCRLYLMGSSPIAYSLNDGGCVFRLRAARTQLVVSKGNRSELVSKIAAAVCADDRIFSTDVGPVMIEGGKMLALTVDRLINLVGSIAVLVVKTAKGDSPTDLTRDTAVLVLSALGT